MYVIFAGNPPIPGAGWKKVTSSDQGPGGKMSVYCVNPAPGDEPQTIVVPEQAETVYVIGEAKVFSDS